MLLYLHRIILRVFLGFIPEPKRRSAIERCKPIPGKNRKWTFTPPENRIVQLKNQDGQVAQSIKTLADDLQAKVTGPALAHQPLRVSARRCSPFRNRIRRPRCSQSGWRYASTRLSTGRYYASIATAEYLAVRMIRTAVYIQRQRLHPFGGIFNPLSLGRKTRGPRGMHPGPIRAHKTANGID